MKPLQLVLLCHATTILLFLCSCAGVETKPTAQTEFEAGLAFFNRGHYYDALEHFEKATELNPEFGKAYLYLGKTFLNLSRWRDALPAFRTAFRLAPEDTKKEVADIIMDILIQNITRIDSDTASDIKDSLKQK